MAQNYEPEVYHQLQAVISEIRDGVIMQLPSAIDVVREQATKNGLPVIVKNCDNCAEVGVPAFIKATEELLESAEEYCQKAKAFFDTFGIEY